MVVMALTGIAAYRTTQTLLEANDLVRHSFLVIGSADAIGADLLEAERGSWGYVMMGDERFLESVDALRSRMAESRKTIRALTADNTSQQRRLDVVDPAIDRELAELTHLSSVRKQQGFPAALAAIQQANGRERAAEIRNLMAVIVNEERILLNERERASQKGAQTAGRIILFGTLAGLLIAGCIGIATRHLISGRLGEFVEFVTAVGDGDLTQKPARESDDEMGKLAHGLNLVLSRLRNTALQTRAVTENLNTAAMEILAAAREQSAVTGEQVAAYQQTNATMQEVSQSSSQITEKAKEVTITAAAVSIANIS